MNKTPKTPIERLTAVMQRNLHGSDTDTWYGFSTEFFLRLKDAMSQQGRLSQGEIARMAEDAESDADAKTRDDRGTRTIEYRMENRI